MTGRSSDPGARWRHRQDGVKTRQERARASRRASASGLPWSGDVLDLRAALTAPVVGVAMTAVSVVLLLLTVALVGYLLWTLVFPERF